MNVGPHDHRRIEAMLFDGLPAREGPYRVPDPARALHGLGMRP